MKKALIYFGALSIAVWMNLAIADEFPNGCVSCHIEGETDTRLDVLLDEVGHGRGGERTREIPVGCNRCHAADDSGLAGSIRQLVHSIHYEAPEENRFATLYGGECSHCHSMDEATGKAGIKVGERNWTSRIVRGE